MIKALGAAFRSVVTAMIMLVGMTYVFAILFRQMLKDADEHGNIKADSPRAKILADYYKDIPYTMMVLFLKGAFPDQMDIVIDTAGDEPHGIIDSLASILVVVYLLLAALTVLNMLVGILCDVVTEVSTFEKEEALLMFVKEELVKLLEHQGIIIPSGTDEDSDQLACMNRETFEELLQKSEAIKVIHKVGVDVVALVDQTDYIFENDKILTFGDFFDVILSLRGTNTATVKDMVDLRKLLRTEMDQMQALIKGKAST
jgi:hypothetical protein